MAFQSAFGYTSTTPRPPTPGVGVAGTDSGVYRTLMQDHIDWGPLQNGLLVLLAVIIILWIINPGGRGGRSSKGERSRPR